MSRNRLSAMKNIYQSTKMNNRSIDPESDDADVAVKKNFEKANFKVLSAFLIAFFGAAYYIFKDPSVK